MTLTRSDGLPAGLDQRRQGVGHRLLELLDDPTLDDLSFRCSARSDLRGRPCMPHVEVNMSVTEELIWLTARTPDNNVINLPDVDDASLEGYRRA